MTEVNFNFISEENYDTSIYYIRRQNYIGDLGRKIRSVGLYCKILSQKENSTSINHFHHSILFFRMSGTKHPFIFME